jgi:hypothetical protein
METVKVEKGNSVLGEFVDIGMDVVGFVKDLVVNLAELLWVAITAFGTFTYEVGEAFHRFMMVLSGESLMLASVGYGALGVTAVVLGLKYGVIQGAGKKVVNILRLVPGLVPVANFIPRSYQWSKEKYMNITGKVNDMADGFPGNLIGSAKDLVTKVFNRKSKK